MIAWIWSVVRACACAVVSAVICAEVRAPNWSLVMAWICAVLSAAKFAVVSARRSSVSSAAICAVVNAITSADVSTRNWLDVNAFRSSVAMLWICDVVR